MISDKILKEAVLNDGSNLYDMSMEKPVLLVFLRHFECIFCREAIKDLSDINKEIEQSNTSLVLVHMADEATAKDYLERYQFSKVLHLSDMDRTLYSEFGLMKGKMGQLLGLKVWSRGFDQIKKGNYISLKTVGDGFQMPGVYLLKKGKITNMFVHNSISDRPDYLKIIAEG